MSYRNTVYAVYTTPDPVDVWDGPCDTLVGIRQTQRGARVLARAWSNKGYGTLTRMVSARDAITLIAAAKAARS